MIKIHLVLSDDWELRGNGSGNMRAIQFDTVKKLTKIYNKYKIKGSFNVEVMQQLYHLKEGEKNSKLKSLATEWEETVKDLYRQGHDIQLHVHPQWLNAEFRDNQWQLNSEWSILNYSREDAKSMLLESKKYLESLIQSIDSSYNCTTFRSGAWCIAPSEHILDILSDIGIKVDTSIVNFLFYDLDMVKLDYRNLEEPCYPYYPDMKDARKISNKKESIICVPTHSFTHSGFNWFIKRLRAKVTHRFLPERYKYFWEAPSETPIPNNQVVSDYGKIWSVNTDSDTKSGDDNKNLVWKKLQKISTLFNSEQYMISDLSALSIASLYDMLRDVRNKAQRSGEKVIPFIIENHTKDIGNFEPIEAFCKIVTRSNDIEVITLKELSENFDNGVYHIRHR